MTEIKLKPCPFCGGKAEVQKFTSMYDCGFCVVCGTEDCQGNVEPENPYRLKKDAIAAWNTRAEEIVHCKDCAYCEEAHYEDNGEPPCIKTCCSLLNRTIQPNDFCSYAERKEFDNGEIHQS